MIALDYLTLRQLSADGNLYSAESLDQRTLARAELAVRRGDMWRARPAITVFFDGCVFWVANLFHRYEAALRSESPSCEFWCEIKQGTKQDAVQFSKGKA